MGFVENYIWILSKTLVL